jgi:hypothetical protein
MATLLGGPGNDTLTISGTGRGIMVGNAGNDALHANGSGRVLMIGGDGADTLTAAASGQAMMIGARTIYDSNLTALDAILAEWASGNNYATRISNILTGSTTGYALTSSAVIADSTGAADTMSGPTTGAAPLNWFIKKSPADKVTKRASETTTQL